MRAEQKTPVWQYILFAILAAGLVAALLLAGQTVRSLVILSVALPAILLWYPGWSCELDNVLRERNSPSTIYLSVGIYFLYCTTVWWYLQKSGGWYAYGCLAWALIFCARGVFPRFVSWQAKRKAERWRALLAERKISPRSWANMSEEERAERRGIHPR